MWGKIMKLIIIFGPHAVGKMTVGQYDLRIERNKTENRLLNKPTKRNIEHSENVFRYLESNYRLNSLENEISKKNYVKINNCRTNDKR